MYKNIEYMRYPVGTCIICMYNIDLKHLYDLDCYGISYYYKLTSSIAEMNFEELDDQRLICGKCCVTLNTVYTFRKMCLRSKTNLISFLSQEKAHRLARGETSDPLDVKPELIVKKEIESDNEDDNCLEKYNIQSNIHESYVEGVQFPASVKEERESEDTSYVATDYHGNERAYSDVKVEVEHQTMIEDEPYEIEIEENPLVAVKYEPSELPQDGSTSHPYAGTSGEPMKREITARTDLALDAEEKIDEPYKCHICQKSFKLRYSLNGHMQVHSRKFSQECKICNKSFLHSNRFKFHMQMHSYERSNKCEKCGKGYKNNSTINMHMKSHSSESSCEC